MKRNVKEEMIEVNGMPIDTITFGSGSRDLILIQGLNTRGIKGGGSALSYLYRRYADDYTVRLFERRPNVPEGITVQELAADVAAAMDTLGIRRADVLGVSQGGMIAQYLAMDRPDLVNKLVLAVTLARNNRTVVDVVNRWVTLAGQDRMDVLIPEMAEALYTERYLQKYKMLMPILKVVQKPSDTERFIRLARACLTCNTYDDLGKITCPVLVIGARKDRIVTGEASEEIAEKLGCRIYMYEDYGHAVYEEAKDFNPRVLSFFKE